MSTLRLIREVTIIAATAGGAVLGYAAGQSFGSTATLVCALFGMSAFGAFADFCMRGGKY